MPKAAPMLTTFDGGELSPLLGARVDLAKYANGCSVMENFLPMVQGPLVRRGGTRFVAPMKSAGRGWLVRFQVSESISYMLELGGNYIRFYTDRGQLVSGGTPVEVATPYSWADLTGAYGTCQLRVVQSNDTMYLFHRNYAPQKLLRQSATSFSLAAVSFTEGPFKDINIDKSLTVTASAETGTVDLVASGALFDAGNVGNLFYMESYDLAAVKPWAVYQEVNVGDRRRVDYRVYQCTAVGAGDSPVTGTLTPTHTEGSAWDGDGIDIANDQLGPIGVEWQYLHSGYGIVRITAVADSTHATADVIDRLPSDLIPGGGSSTVVTERDISAMSPDDTNVGEVTINVGSGHGFTTGDTIVVAGTILSDSSAESPGPDASLDGSYIIKRTTSSSVNVTVAWPGSGYVYSPSSTGTATRTVTTTYPDNAPTYKWAHALFSSIEGWPEHGAFWRERLVLARDRTIAMSVVGDFENFSAKENGEVVADSAIVQTLNARQINRIVWISESDELVLGTDGDEWVVGPIQTAQAVAPDNIRAARRTAYGSRAIQPAEVGGKLLFVQAGGKKLRDYQYDYASDNYISSDSTKLNPSISLSGIVDLSYQQEPDSIIWCARADGVLVGVTYDQEMGRSDVYAWHRHPLVNGAVESVETMPAPDGASDDLWLIVRRVINGQTVRYIEYLNAPLADDADQAGSFYVDCGLTYSGAPVTEVSGLSHLEGQVVDVLIDGATHPQRTVQAGSIPLQSAASVVQVGIPAPCRFATMSLEAGAANGTAQGKIKRITNVVMRLYRSLGGKLGGDPDNLEILEFRRPSNAMGRAVPLFSGDTVPVPWREGYETISRIWVVNDQPLPMTVLGLMPIVQTQDDRG